MGNTENLAPGQKVTFCERGEVKILTVKARRVVIEYDITDEFGNTRFRVAAHHLTPVSFVEDKG